MRKNILFILLTTAMVIFAKNAWCLEAEIQREFMASKPKLEAGIREGLHPAIAFLNDLTRRLIETTSEHEIRRLSPMVRAIVGSGLGFGGIDDKKKATPKENTIMLHAIQVAEQVEPQMIDEFYDNDYFKYSTEYIPLIHRMNVAALAQSTYIFAGERNTDPKSIWIDGKTQWVNFYGIKTPYIHGIRAGFFDQWMMHKNNIEFIKIHSDNPHITLHTLMHWQPMWSEQDKRYLLRKTLELFDSKKITEEEIMALCAYGSIDNEEFFKAFFERNPEPLNNIENYQKFIMSIYDSYNSAYKLWLLKRLTRVKPSKAIYIGMFFCSPRLSKQGRLDFLNFLEENLSPENKEIYKYIDLNSNNSDRKIEPDLKQQVRLKLAHP